MTKKCDTPSCENEVFSADLCKNCYSGTYYWKKKGVKAMMVRKKQLTVLSERLDHLRPSNVVHFPHRRRA